MSKKDYYDVLGVSKGASDDELKKGIDKNRNEVISYIEKSEGLKFERKGEGWDSYPNTKSRLKAKYGCYRILDFLLNDQNDSSILGLFAFGIFTKYNINDNLSFFVCIISVIIVTIIFYLPEGYLGGYKIGYELLPINGLITFFGLYIIRKSTT